MILEVRLARLAASKDVVLHKLLLQRFALYLWSKSWIVTICVYLKRIMLILRLFMCNGNPSLAVLPQLTQWCSSFLDVSSSVESLSSAQAQEASPWLGVIRYVWRDRFTVIHEILLSLLVCLENTGAGRFCGRLIQPCPLHSIDESTVNQDPIESRAKLPRLLMNQPHHQYSHQPSIIGYLAPLRSLPRPSQASLFIIITASTSRHQCVHQAISIRIGVAWQYHLSSSS